MNNINYKDTKQDKFYCKYCDKNGVIYEKFEKTDIINHAFYQINKI